MNSFLIALNELNMAEIPSKWLRSCCAPVTLFDIHVDGYKNPTSP